MFHWRMVEWSLTGVERQHGAYRFIVKDKEGDAVWIVAEPRCSRSKPEANSQILLS
jgi:hypothetical protein